MNRMPLLDLTRWVAAVFVVLFHYIFMIDAIRENNIFISETVKYGYLGVHLFFMISGFVIFMTVDKKNTPLAFFIARAIRLYPSYVLSILLTCIAMFAIQGTFKFSLKEIAANLTMFADSIGSSSINPAYWSLAVEVIFYFIVFCSLFFINNTKKIMIVILFWLTLSIINIFISLGIFEKLLILKYCPLFVGGAGFYLYMKTKATKYLFYAFLSLPVSIYYSIKHSQKLSEQFQYFHFSWITVSILITLFYMYMFFITLHPSRGDKMNRKLINYLAGSSYIIYLIHETAGKAFIKMHIEYGLLTVFITILFVLAISIALFLKVEIPLQNKIKEQFYPKKIKNHSVVIKKN
ncbi:acyltransferase family protein [Sodalis sp. RH22]|uniref:acyltransferase family protein n=1 Tax=unclassified Sodalis (in: enterobacteria) TaxID=2636512 RepID=UPI0039B6C3E1